MISGDKPNGYFTKYDAKGNKIEGETRQCVHCQYIWEYVPGSGKRRAICLSCKGLTCARPECMEDQQRKIAGTRFRCMPLTEWNKRKMESIYKQVPDAIIDGNKVTIPDGHTMLASGIIVKS